MSYTPTEWESTDVVTATRLNALEQAVGDLNMSYTPNVWQNGDILTADKMNALEQAVASGGGGSSDFTTATVTYSNAGYSQVTISLLDLHTTDDYELGLNGYLFEDFTVMSHGDEYTVTVPLYKGNYVVVNNSGSSPVVTGDVSLIADGELILIQGDGTVTFQ